MEAERPEPIERIDNRQFDELHSQELNEKTKMTEKLTLDWCFKYPNARIKYNFAKTESCESIDSFLTYSHLHKRDISDCKLILRPLSSLTAEERHYIGKKFIPFEIKEFEWMDVKDYIRVLYSHNILDFVDYLRSINIDIDGLQERGIAVYE